MINHIWGNVYIGDEQDALSQGYVNRTGITAVLDLRELHIDEKLDKEAIHQVGEAIIELKRLTSNGNKVLVHCHAGMDRAPFVVAYYLHVWAGYSFQDAYDLVKGKRPQTIEHWEWFSQFKEEAESRVDGG